MELKFGRALGPADIGPPPFHLLAGSACLRARPGCRCLADCALPHV